MLLNNLKRLMGARGIFLGMSFLSFVACFIPSAHAQVYSTKATHAILIDADSGITLYEKRSRERMKPASMAKVLTLAVLFDALVKGQIALHDTVTISENAWRKGGANSGGSTMFAELGSDVSVENLIRGVAIQSGNDASIALAESLSGSEEAFTKRMNAFAKSIGMVDSNFVNATGLPDPAQYTTAADLARLALYVTTNYPDLYKIFSEREFTWNKIRQFNRNPLLRLDIGADGIKTGHTKESGFGMIGSAKQGNRRLIMVINGLEKKKQRSEEGKRLLEWGFRSFESIELFAKDEEIGKASVFGGEEAAVAVGANKAVQLLLPKGQGGRISARIHYRGPLKAPIAAGSKIGTLIVKVDGNEKLRQPVYTQEDVGIGTIKQRALDALYELTIGKTIGQI